MAGFNFNLQSILGIKEKIEEQKKIELGNATIFLNAQIDVLNVLIEQHNELINLFNQKNGKKFLAKELIDLNVSIKYYDDEILQQRDVIKKAEKAVEDKRVALNHAVMERKTYEKLKEIAYENYQKEELSENAKILDEIISFKYSS
ncbi:MAG: flagellar export protein FliJ [Vallitaleaceae bacterium]|nr:flagellar export protein FliJ [Vallitaleaceae bacterium]